MARVSLAAQPASHPASQPLAVTDIHRPTTRNLQDMQSTIEIYKALGFTELHFKILADFSKSRNLRRIHCMVSFIDCNICFSFAYLMYVAQGGWMCMCSQQAEQTRRHHLQGEQTTKHTNTHKASLIRNRNFAIVDISILPRK